jgi:hypothetical protein
MVSSKSTIMSTSQCSHRKRVQRQMFVADADPQDQVDFKLCALQNACMHSMMALFAQDQTCSNAA